MQELVDAELTAAIGAAPHERTDARSNHRNGTRSRLLSTPAGDVELRIPKLRVGSFFPSLLEPGRRLDHVTFPYVYLDATYIKARINHRIVSRAVVVATGVTANKR